jgi:hypothetical protein
MARETTLPVTISFRLSADAAAALNRALLPYEKPSDLIRDAVAREVARRAKARQRSKGRET